MKRYSKIIKYLLAVFIFAMLFYIVDLQALLNVFSNLTIEIIVLLILISILLVYISALKWSLFLNSKERNVSAIKLFNLYLMGYFINLILPSYIGGDVARSWYAGKVSGQKKAFSATIMERLTGFIAMMLMGVLAVFLVPDLSQEIRLAVVIIGLGLFLGIFLIFNNSFFKIFKIIPFINKFYQQILEVQDILKTSFKNKSLLSKTLFLSFLFHCFAVVNTYYAGVAVGWTNIPVADLFVVLPLILLIGAIPITPSGLGLQEGAFFYFLTMLGASPEEALGVGLVLRAKVYLLAIFGGIVFLLEKRK